MENIIKTEKLTKMYGKSRGIIDVDLTVKQGEIFGLIGPNGAGKSTIIRTLLSLIHKTSGECSVFELDSQKHSTTILKDVGYLPSEVFYYDNMKAIDLLKYSASFYKKDCSKRIKELADLLELDLNKKIEDMSLGNKKKVGIIQGILHNPKLIILDEPTSGLDPLIQRKFFDLIKEENKNGATILFSSHILSEVQRICDRVAVIKEGKIVAVQDISELKKNSYKKVELTFSSEYMPDEIDIDGARNITVKGTNISFLYNGNSNNLLCKLCAYNIEDVEIKDLELEEMFMHYYK